MASIKEVRAWLDPEEPDYPGAAAALGPAALPALRELIQGGDLGLASKATYLASMIPGPAAVDALRAAHARNEPLLRVAAASGIRNLPRAAAEQVFELLHDDPDAGVRKVVLQSAVVLDSPAVLARVRSLAASDPEPFVRELADTVARTAPRPPR